MFTLCFLIKYSMVKKAKNQSFSFAWNGHFPWNMKLYAVKMIIKKWKILLHKLPTLTESFRLMLLFSFHRMLLFSRPWSLYREYRFDANMDFVRIFLWFFVCYKIRIMNWIKIHDHNLNWLSKLTNCEPS